MKSEVERGYKCAHFLNFFLHISTESEQNQLLNFIIIDQCKSVLFYRI